MKQTKQTNKQKNQPNTQKEKTLECKIRINISRQFIFQLYFLLTLFMFPNTFDFTIAFQTLIFPSKLTYRSIFISC